MLKYIYETVFSSVNVAIFLAPLFFLANNTSKLFHFLQIDFFISVDIIRVYVMSSPTSQSSPAFHSFFNKEKTSAETATKLDFISYIWDDDHIMRLDEKNWQCLWRNKIFQGINTTNSPKQ